MKWELKKLIKGKGNWLFLALFLFLNMYRIGQEGRLVSDPLEGHGQLLGQIQGIITNEKIRFVTESLQAVSAAIESGQAQPGEYDPQMFTGYAYGDQYEFQYFYDELFYCYSYEAKIAQLIERAEDARRLYEASGNEAEAGRCRMIETLYRERALPSYYEMERIERYLSYDFSELFVLLFLILSLPALVFRDFAEGVNEMLAVSEKGGYMYYFRKSAAAAIWTAGTALVFHLQDFYLYGMFSQRAALLQPLYAIRGSQMGMYASSVLSFCLLNFFSRLMVYWCAGQGILLLAAIMQRPVYTAVLAMAATGVLAVLEYGSPGICNPAGLLNLFEQQKTFAAVTLAGKVYPAYWSDWIFCGIYLLVFLSLFCIAAEKARKRKK